MHREATKAPSAAIDIQPVQRPGARSDPTRQLVIRDRSAPDGAAPLTVEESRSRALPGHRIWRVRDFGLDRPLQQAAHELPLLARAAEARPRVLRCQLRILDPEDDRRHSLAAFARHAGFVENPLPESYTWTILIELGGTPEAVFARLGATARRHIRRAQRAGLHTRALETVQYARKLAEIEAATKVRNDATYAGEDWARWLNQAAERPENVRIAGLFNGTQTAPDQLIAFALGVRRAGMVEYRAAGNLRLPDGNLPLGYLPAWDLLAWANERGADLFDFGGVPDPGAADLDPARQRIAQFKRHFAKTERPVAEELVYQARPWRNRLAAMLSETRAALRRTLSGG